MSQEGGALSNFAAVAVGQTSVKARADEVAKGASAGAAVLQDQVSSLPPQVDDEDEEESDKTFMEIVEENAFAIEAFLYFVFLILFTIYAGEFLMWT